MPQDETGTSQPPGASNIHNSRGSFPTQTKAVMARMKAHNLPLTAAGVAFFSFLALIPALVAVVSLYGIFGDPDAIESTVNDIAGTLPEGARGLIVDELGKITATSHSAHKIGFLTATLAALWSVSSGVGHLIQALNTVYEFEESRSFVARRLQALLFTAGAVVFVVVAVGAISVWPPVVSSFSLPSGVSWLLRLAVWPVLAIGLAAGLATLYRYGPNRSMDLAKASSRFVSVGSSVAVAAWLAASVGFQFYSSNFAKYNRTYGSLAAVVLLLTWLWITALVALLGAEINAYRDEAMQVQHAPQTRLAPRRPRYQKAAHPTL